MTLWDDIPAEQKPIFPVSTRLLTPVLVIERDSDGNTVRLEGRRNRRSGHLAVPFPDPSQDWSVYEGQVYLVAKDVPSQFQDLLSGSNPNKLSLARTFEIYRHPANFQVELKDGVLTFDGKGETQTPVPSGLQATLFPYQEDGFAWMKHRAEQAGGFILADEMGLGKTIQVIALLLDMSLSPDKPALVVAPTTLLTNWKNELLKFAPSLSHIIHRGSARTGVASGLKRSDITITTYDTLVQDRTLFESLDWRCVILDEAQAVRNPETARRIALTGLRRDIFIPMTGTPVETSLRDLWSLLDLSIPGLLGSLEEFEDNFDDDPASAELLSKMTGALVLRRRVEDVAKDLPERIDIDVSIDAPDSFYSGYEELRQEVLAKFPVAGHLVAVNQLSMFCAHDALALRNDETIDETISNISSEALMTPKLEATLALLEEAFLNNRKVIVFASFNGLLGLIERASAKLPEAYWNAINGTTLQEDRQKIVDDFSAYDGPGCLVLNPKAAGAGLNITAATIVIHYTLYWNPALEAQASARAHRRGQTEPVRVYRLFYPDTVEEIMIERSEYRAEIGNITMKDSERNRADLDRALAKGIAR